MARAGLTRDAVVDIGLSIVDSSGPEALTLTAVADRAGVAPPSLYKHVAGLPVLRSLLAVRVLDEITAALTAATIGRSGADAVASLMHAYRDYAAGHPHRYASVPADPLHDPALREVAGQQLTVVRTVLDACGVADSDAVHTIRALRATVHGFAHIEAAGGFGLEEDVDISFRRMVDVFVRAIPGLTT
ncbi:TetR/AcrR family transcriptional regulator [Brevibacterium yomogidense]|uniref:TetR/AcrR family transcriptional regulator n=1 Tax=Brevibacterium yomogidense TaxID=946573 RepID=UPI0018DFFB1D|nr:TetR/AcrR family transcriptional regulator [Brevibacterium yomogidense]